MRRGSTDANPTRRRRLSARRAWSSRERLIRQIVSPLVATAGALLLGEPNSTGLGSAVLVGVVVTTAMVMASTRGPLTAHLPFVRRIYFLVGPALAGAGLLFLKITSAVPGLTLGEVVFLAALAACSQVLMLRPAGLLGSTSRGARIAVVGSSRTARLLADELLAQGKHRFDVIGFIADRVDDPVTGPDSRPPRLGSIGELASIVERHAPELLLVAGDVSRLAFFEEMADACFRSTVRVLELCTFYEAVFGHVALTEINATWFQYVLHPRYTTGTPLAKRLFDLSIAVPVLVLLAPVVALLAALVRCDGGPVLYRQVRIGEGGRLFTILKLRSMRVHDPQAAPSWTVYGDNRVTSVGGFMRRTHLDEVPQLVNVLRGEMSIVGPRPEQPAFVERLEQMIPFYNRRHLIRPGITGWAQVRCGYSGSDAGAAFKVCHDLYYVKHRSALLDVLIVFETLRAVVADRPWAPDPTVRAFVWPTLADGLDVEAVPG